MLESCEHPEPEEIAPPIYLPAARPWIPAPKGQVTEHFSYEELRCRHCHRIPSRAAILNTARWAEKLRHEVFGDRPMGINSAARCWVHNAAIGGVPGSTHTLGWALDFTVSGLTVVETYALISEHQGAGKLVGGLGRYRTFVHADRGTPRRWSGH